MTMFEDITGKIFNNWKVLKRVADGKRKETQYLCECKCGTKRIVKAYALKNGRSKSCGCLRAELARDKHIKHGKTGTRIYNIWRSMKKRCYIKSSKDYIRYGKRGILICSEWKESFENFYNWAINNGYNDNLTIDRIDVNGNYEPSNCRWITMKEQQSNKRSNHLITYKGVTLPVCLWADKYKIKRSTLCTRLKQGVNFEQAITIKGREL